MIRRLLVVALTISAVAACGGGSSSGSGSGSNAPTAAPSAQTVTFTETEFKITTASTSLPAGSYTFDVQNKGSFPHDLHIATPDGSEIGATSVIQPGGSATLQVTLKAGSYTLWCAVDSHRAQGMQGTLTVT
jgi:plastocyanin